MLLPGSSGLTTDTNDSMDAATSALVRAVQNHEAPFLMQGKSMGVEFRAMNEVEGRPNRAVGLLFRIAEGSFEGRRALFFFKESQVPTSRNRFAYGTVILPNGVPNIELIRACLDYAASGFHAEKRPDALRRAVNFMVPGSGDKRVVAEEKTSDG